MDIATHKVQGHCYLNKISGHYLISKGLFSPGAVKTKQTNKQKLLTFSAPALLK